MNEIWIKHFDKQSEISFIKSCFNDHGIDRGEQYFEQCYVENLNGSRSTFLAFTEHTLAGWGNLLFEPAYAYFRENHIPEINDLIVFPPYRKSGIGTRLMRTLEHEASYYSDKVGLAVGLYSDYGGAQRRYAERGYIPNGKGIHSGIEPGTKALVDDDLLLYYTKNINEGD